MDLARQELTAAMSNMGYGSAEALADDLRRWQLGEPIAARPVRRGEGARKWVRRNPAVAALMFAVVVAVAGGGIGFGVKYFEAKDQARIAHEKTVFVEVESQRAKEEGELKDVALREVRAQLANGLVAQAQMAYQNNDVAGALALLDRVPTEPEQLRRDANSAVRVIPVCRGNVVRLVDRDLVLEPDVLACRHWFTRPDPEWHAAEAERFARAGQWAPAEFHFRRLHAIQPERIDLCPLAICQAAAHDSVAYRRTCAELLYPDSLAVVRLLSMTPISSSAILCPLAVNGLPSISPIGLSAVIGGWVEAPMISPPAMTRRLRACLLMPGVVTNPTRFLSLVPEADPVTRAAILVRAGKHDDAAKLLSTRTEPMALLFLALAEHGRGNVAEAKRTLQNAAGQLDASVAADPLTVDGAIAGWQTRVEAEVLRAEAQSVLAKSKP
jgi:predicted negative regulator of RcsB-dependent stress response